MTWRALNKIKHEIWENGTSSGYLKGSLNLLWKVAQQMWHIWMQKVYEWGRIIG